MMAVMFGRRKHFNVVHPVVITIFVSVMCVLLRCQCATQRCRKQYPAATNANSIGNNFHGWEKWVRPYPNSPVAINACRRIFAHHNDAMG